MTLKTFNLHGEVAGGETALSSSWISQMAPSSTKSSLSSDSSLFSSSFPTAIYLLWLIMMSL
jgi:hypothetical protein